MPFDRPPGEDLCRFLTSKDHYSVQKHVVKHTAFHPPRDNRLSVYWVTGIADDEVWAIGDAHVAPQRGPILGLAAFNSLRACYECDLRVEVTGVPHPRHADVIGWSVDKQRARLQALKLADKSSLKLR